MSWGEPRSRRENIPFLNLNPESIPMSHWNQIIVVWLKKASCPKGMFLKMLALLPQCFLILFYMLSLCYCKTSKFGSLSFVCGRLPVFQWTGQLAWGQGAYSLERCSAPSSARSSPPLGDTSCSGKGSLKEYFFLIVVTIQCCTMGLGLLLWCLVANFAAVCQENQVLSAFVKNFEGGFVGLFFSIQLLYPSTGRSPWDNHLTWVLGDQGHFL